MQPLPPCLTQQLPGSDLEKQSQFSGTSTKSIAPGQQGCASKCGAAGGARKTCVSIESTRSTGWQSGGHRTAGMLPAGSPPYKQAVADAGTPELPERDLPLGHSQVPGNSPRSHNPQSCPSIHSPPHSLKKGPRRQETPQLSSPPLPVCVHVLPAAGSSRGGPGWHLLVFSPHPSPAQRSPARSCFGLLTHPATLPHQAGHHH